MMLRSWIAGLSLGFALVACGDDGDGGGNDTTATTTATTDATSSTTEDTSVPTEVEGDTSVPTEVEGDAVTEPDVEPDSDEPDSEGDTGGDTSVPTEVEPDTTEPPRVYDPIPGTWDASLDFWLPGLQGDIGPRAYAMVKNGETDEVFIAGIFETVGDLEAKNVVRWTAADGFSSMGEGLANPVHALALGPDGKVFAGQTGGGGFISSPGTVTEWNGEAWLPLAFVDSFTPIRVMTYGSHGLVVGGEFTMVQNPDFSGSTDAPYLAIWDGAMWSAIPEGSPDGPVYSIAYHAGELCIGGNFTKVGTVDALNIACLGESGWHALGDGLNSQVNALYSEDDNNLMAGGFFSFGDPGGPPTEFVVGLGRFTTGTSAWVPVAGGVSRGGITNVWTITPAGDDGLWIGGNFREVNSAAPIQTQHLALLDGNNWVDVGGMRNDLGATLFSEHGPRAIVPDGEGYLIAGLFSSAGGVAAVNLVRYEDKNFAAVGAQPSPGGIPGGLNSISFGPNGALYVGGEFAAAGGVAPSPRVAKLVFPEPVQGIIPTPPPKPEWKPLGDGLPDTVWVIQAARDGKVYAGGRFARGFARIDDTTVERAEWDYPGELDGGVFTIVQGLEERDDDDIYIGGDFANAGTTAVAHIARFTGTTFQPLGVGLNDRVQSILPGPDGEIYVGGMFDGTGDYDPEEGTGAPIKSLAKWTGSGWEEVGGGVYMDDGPFGMVRSLAWYQGQLLVVGQFERVGPDEGAEISSVALFDGANWHPVGVGNELRYDFDYPMPLAEVAVQDNGFFLVGSTPNLFIDGNPVNHVLWWNGSAWETVGAAFNDLVEDVAIAPDGKSVFFGGFFLKTVDKPTLGLSHWLFDDTVGTPIDE